jgi:tRNA dimethylallyltransferase
LIVVGGTGLYTSALVHGLPHNCEADPGLRAYWTERCERHGIQSLQEELRRRSPGQYQALDDKQNFRRLLRALELAAAGIAGPDRSWKDAPSPAAFVGLRYATEHLNSRIESRVTEMYAQGLLEEAQALVARYGTLSATAAKAIGYAEAFDCLAGRCSREEAVSRTVRRTKQLARRQRTWFAHQAEVRWIDVSPDMGTEAVAGQVLEQWMEHGPTRLSV